MLKKPEDFGLEATGNCDLNASEAIPDEDIYQVEFFTDTKKLEKEKLQQRTRLMKPCLSPYSPKCENRTMGKMYF